MRQSFKIRVEHVHPPIPFRGMDWQAFIDGEEENSGMYGSGKTMRLALEDLIDTLEMEAEECASSR